MGLDPESQKLHEELDRLVGYDENLRLSAEAVLAILTDPRLPRKDALQWLVTVIAMARAWIVLDRLEEEKVSR